MTPLEYHDAHSKADDNNDWVCACILQPVQGQVGLVSYTIWWQLLGVASVLVPVIMLALV